MSQDIHLTSVYLPRIESGAAAREAVIVTIRNASELNCNTIVTQLPGDMTLPIFDETEKRGIREFHIHSKLPSPKNYVFHVIFSYS